MAVRTSMLLTRPQTKFRSLSTAISSATGVQSSLYLRPFQGYVHVRQWSTKRITFSPYSQISGNLSPSVLKTIPFVALQNFSTTRSFQQDSAINSSNRKLRPTSNSKRLEETQLEFQRTIKGEAARAVDLSARLKDRSTQAEKGEVIRLLKLAGREWRALSGIIRIQGTSYR